MLLIKLELCIFLLFWMSSFFQI